MTRGKKIALGSLATSALVVGLIVYLIAAIGAPPLHVGSTADDAWTYIHTNLMVRAAASSRYQYWRSLSRGTADAKTVHWQTDFFYRTNQLLATRTITYTLNNSGVISQIKTHWNLNWRTNSAPAVSPTAPPSKRLRWL